MKKIIEKIQKLYALAGGTDFPEEAESAVAKAQELLHEHNLTLNVLDFKSEETGSCLEREVFTGLKHHTEWVDRLACHVGHAFSVDVLFGNSMKYHDKKEISVRRAAVYFIGIEPDVSIAEHSFAYLAGVALRHREKGKNRTQLNHWRIGFARAVGRRLMEFKQQSEQHPQETGLVLAKSAIVEKYISKNYPDLKAHRTKRTEANMEDLLEGMKAGDEIPLSRPIEQDETAFIATLS